ncbi:MAG TPA: tetratricopeptide repeat protein [Pyrinomonadaceae bacterium]
MKRSVCFLALVFCLLTVLPANNPVSAKDNWLSVRSKNFFLVGNASEKEIRQVGVQLEQFREVFSRLFSRANFNSPVPTTVIVFKSDSSYRPFKPGPNTAGYFQAGQDVNYITLTTELSREKYPFAVIFHEYTHLLVNNTSGNAPSWFNEGLAEYYSTFTITDDQKIRIGNVISSHVFRLREKILPLRVLFEVDHASPYYNERDKQSVFYAQSWALMHYLILGKNGERMPQLDKFMNLMSANVPVDQAFQQAFAMSLEAMEKELREYIKLDNYPVFAGHFDSKVTLDTSMEAAPITEAEAQAYLGDLLLHSNRAESESYLKKALALDPTLATANASMGMLRVREGKTDEALKYLEAALAANSQNYLIHYYYAFALSRQGNSDMQPVMHFEPESARRMKEELKKAIALRPDYPESYSLLAFVNLVTGSEIDESMAMLKGVLKASPGRNDIVFMLAQLYLHKQDFTTARQMLEPLTRNSDLQLRQQSQAMLDQLTAMEEQRERFNALNKERAANGGGPPGLRENVRAELQVEEIPKDPSHYLREALRKPNANETQTQGTLVKIECEAKGMVFVVKVEDRLLRLRAANFEALDITTYSSDSGGEITCGPRKLENNVIVAYTPSKDPRAKADGVVTSVEFVPTDFKLKP